MREFDELRRAMRRAMNGAFLIGLITGMLLGAGIVLLTYPH
jgi:hypothetical protein